MDPWQCGFFLFVLLTRFDMLSVCKVGGGGDHLHLVCSEPRLMAACFVSALPLRDDNVYFEFLCTETFLFLWLSPVFLCLIVVLHHFFCLLFSILFPSVCDISLPCGACHALCCFAVSSVSLWPYATVCICSFITDAPHWQRVQLCMAVCFFLISQEILSCVMFVVQNVWMCVRVRVCLCVRAIEHRF